MVDNGIGVDTDSSGSAGLNRVAELLTGSTTTLKLVRDGLVVEPPWVELTLLGPLVGEDGLRDGEQLDSHPAGLTEELALFLDISVRPSEKLNDSTLLTVLVNIRLVNLIGLEHEVHWFK